MGGIVIECEWNYYWEWIFIYFLCFNVLADNCFLTIISYKLGVNSIFTRNRFRKRVWTRLRIRYFWINCSTWTHIGTILDFLIILLRTRKVLIKCKCRLYLSHKIFNIIKMPSPINKKLIINLNLVIEQELQERNLLVTRIMMCFNVNSV